MPKARETVLEIDLSALAHNYHYLCSRLQKEVKFMAVVKAFGYGSDVAAIAGKLTQLGADYLAVAYTGEGIALRNAGITLPILVLHPQAVNYRELIENCLEPNLFSESVLRKFIEVADDLNQKNYPVHLKLNTGLNRLGFSEEEIEKVTNIIRKTSSVEVKSLYSHLAASDDWREREFTLEQIYSFRRMAQDYNERTNTLPLLHICNTSGILNYPEAAFDMVRSGIGLYGYGNDPGHDKNLKPVSTLKTIVSQVHHLQKGASVGYNRAFKAKKSMKTATLPLGYADGISRHFGNGRAVVSINGQQAPIIGDVCMDMIMIDVTGIDCEEGDEVIIFGSSPNATEFAKSGQTISYEVITAVSQRVKRNIIEE